ncbi:PREDICTED: disintegrin and metalloproteinase domain-containing protein 12-like [Priapulus caudatus]|uniref:Disintegrin and metalloproteinase domain-containing protein 12-like n=1 Tax=Priapulus caudatus TaxID=37621 RepID=A0ABM1E498_PRICU|nr:PREDICTED: disintegrin and metalloproteinase domain-containing protein 12-like [Priapulus caudatus]
MEAVRIGYCYLCSCYLTILLSNFAIFKLAYATDEIGTHIQRIHGSLPSQEFQQHDITVPFQLVSRQKRHVDTFTESGHLPETSFVFEAFQKTFTVDLSLNRDLFTSNYIEKHFIYGKPVIRNDINHTKEHCYYHGQVRGIPKSAAAISTCSGISGFVDDGEEAYHIEPVKDSSHGHHFVYRTSDLIPQIKITGYNDTVDAMLLNLPTDRSQLLRRRKRYVQGPDESNQYSKYVELYIVNDKREFESWDRDLKKVITRSKEIANVVNALYKPLNTYIALTGVEVWTHEDEIKLSVDGDETLFSFLTYRQERLIPKHPNDNAQLISGMVFNGGVVGKAYRGLICSFEYSAGVTMDHSRLVLPVATTLAHELGHNFGMEHDIDSCECPEKKCIMSPSSGSFIPRHWSACSYRYWKKSLRRELDYCLHNKPYHIFESPMCGNGYVEEGETCDCGLPEFCDSPCCNATSCQIYPNATCATGMCCDLTTCKHKPPATLCRQAVSECDLPEFCRGDSLNCPDDVHVQDGEGCAAGKAYCYDGTCSSHESQCKRIWGPTGRVSASECFDHNLRGTERGNCGYFRNNKTFTACMQENIMCGLLHCTHLNERTELGMESVTRLSRSFIHSQHGSAILPCHTAMIDLGLNNRDPGLTPNGAKCGDNMMCINESCQSVEDIKIFQCPEQCHNKGVCNNRGHCHCIEGYSPPLCDVPGLGGSIDSGPPLTSIRPSRLLVILLCLFVSISFLIVAVLVVIFKHKGLRDWMVLNSAKKTKKQAFMSSSSVVKTPRKTPSMTSKPIASVPSFKMNNGVTSPTCDVPVRPAPAVPLPSRPSFNKADIGRPVANGVAPSADLQPLLPPPPQQQHHAVHRTHSVALPAKPHPPTVAKSYSQRDDAGGAMRRPLLRRGSSSTPETDRRDPLPPVGGPIGRQRDRGGGPSLPSYDQAVGVVDAQGDGAPASSFARYPWSRKPHQHGMLPHGALAEDDEEAAGAHAAVANSLSGDIDEALLQRNIPPVRPLPKMNRPRSSAGDQQHVARSPPPKPSPPRLGAAVQPHNPLHVQISAKERPAQPQRPSPVYSASSDVMPLAGGHPAGRAASFDRGAAALGRSAPRRSGSDRTSPYTAGATMKSFKPSPPPPLSSSMTSFKPPPSSAPPGGRSTLGRSASVAEASHAGAPASAVRRSASALPSQPSLPVYQNVPRTLKRSASQRPTKPPPGPPVPRRGGSLTRDASPPRVYGVSDDESEHYYNTRAGDSLYCNDVLGARDTLAEAEEEEEEEDYYQDVQAPDWYNANNNHNAVQETELSWHTEVEGTRKKGKK